MPDYENILYEKQRGGVLITLNRPEVMNAIHVKMGIRNSDIPGARRLMIVTMKFSAPANDAKPRTIRPRT